MSGGFKPDDREGPGERSIRASDKVELSGESARQNLACDTLPACGATSGASRGGNVGA